MPDTRSPFPQAVAPARPRTVCLLALAVLLASSVLAGCGPSGSRPSGVLRLPLYGDPGIPDPALGASQSSLFLDSLLYSGLVKLGPDLHVIPELAVSIPTISADGRTYTFTVRQDARFADGRRCTAADVAYSLARALSPALHSPWAPRYLGNIEGARQVEAGLASTLSGVQIADPLTLRIQLVQPDATFLAKLAFPVAAVVDRRVIVGYGRGRWVDRPAGTGPWFVAARQHGSLVLAPRRHFYGGRLHLRSIVLVPIRSGQAALDLYRKGSLDAAEVPPERYLADSARSDFHQSDGLDAYYALARAPVAIRLAASLDRSRLVQDASPALSSLSSIVPPAVPDYVSSPPTIDPGLVQDAGPPRVSLRASDPGAWLTRRLARALERQWKPSRSGIPVRLVHVQHLLPDPGLWLHIVLDQTRSSWFRSVLHTEQQLTNDPVTRMSTYSQAENWALATGLIIPLAGGSIDYLIKPVVQSLQVTPLGLMPENNTWTTVSVE